MATEIVPLSDGLNLCAYALSERDPFPTGRFGEIAEFIDHR